MTQLRGRVPRRDDPRQLAYVVFTQQGRELVAFARGILRSHDAADDVVQDVLTRVAAGRIPAEKALNPGYMMASVRNRSIDYLRRRSRTLTFEDAEAALTLVHSGAYRGSHPPVDDFTEGILLEDSLLRGFRLLPEADQFLLGLVIADLTYVEIADVLECDQSAARKRVERARRRLHALLDGPDREEGSSNG